MSFNTYGNKRWEVNSGIPVWCGKVRPVTLGGTLASEYVVEDALYRAGTPVHLSADTHGVITPLISFTVVSGDGTTAVIRPNGGTLPYVGLVLTKLGASFSATGASYAITAVTASASEDNAYEVTFGTSLGTLSKDDILVEGASEGASAAPKVTPNGYLYNDICTSDIDPALGNASATGAVVKFHGEGLLIDRTSGAGMAELLQSLIPNVILVKGV